MAIAQSQQAQQPTIKQPIPIPLSLNPELTRVLKIPTYLTDTKGHYVNIETGAGYSSKTQPKGIIIQTTTEELYRYSGVSSGGSSKSSKTSTTKTTQPTQPTTTQPTQPTQQSARTTQQETKPSIFNYAYYQIKNPQAILTPEQQRIAQQLGIIQIESKQNVLPKPIIEDRYIPVYDEFNKVRGYVDVVTKQSIPIENIQKHIEVEKTKEELLRTGTIEPAKPHNILEKVSANVGKAYKQFKEDVITPVTTTAGELFGNLLKKAEEKELQKLYSLQITNVSPIGTNLIGKAAERMTGKLEIKPMTPKEIAERYPFSAPEILIKQAQENIQTAINNKAASITPEITKKYTTQAQIEAQEIFNEKYMPKIMKEISPDMSQSQIDKITQKYINEFQQKEGKQIQNKYSKIATDTIKYKLITDPELNRYQENIEKETTHYINKAQLEQQIVKEIGNAIVLSPIAFAGGSVAGTFLGKVPLVSTAAKYGFIGTSVAGLISTTQTQAFKEFPAETISLTAVESIPWFFFFKGFEKGAASPEAMKIRTTIEKSPLSKPLITAENFILKVETIKPKPKIEEIYKQQEAQIAKTEIERRKLLSNIDTGAERAGLLKYQTQIYQNVAEKFIRQGKLTPQEALQLSPFSREALNIKEWVTPAQTVGEAFRGTESNILALRDISSENVNNIAKQIIKNYRREGLPITKQEALKFAGELKEGKTLKYLEDLTNKFKSALAEKGIVLSKDYIKSSIESSTLFIEKQKPIYPSVFLQYTKEGKIGIKKLPKLPEGLESPLPESKIYTIRNILQLEGFEGTEGFGLQWKEGYKGKPVDIKLYREFSREGPIIFDIYTTKTKPGPLPKGEIQKPLLRLEEIQLATARNVGESYIYYRDLITGKAIKGPKIRTSEIKYSTTYEGKGTELYFLDEFMRTKLLPKETTYLTSQTITDVALKTKPTAAVKIEKYGEATGPAKIELLDLKAGVSQKFVQLGFETSRGISVSPAVKKVKPPSPDVLQSFPIEESPMSFDLIYKQPLALQQQVQSQVYKQIPITPSYTPSYRASQVNTQQQTSLSIPTLFIPVAELQNQTISLFQQPKLKPQQIQIQPQIPIQIQQSIQNVMQIPVQRQIQQQKKVQIPIQEQAQIPIQEQILVQVPAQRVIQMPVQEQAQTQVQIIAQQQVQPHITPQIKQNIKVELPKAPLFPLLSKQEYLTKEKITKPKETTAWIPFVKIKGEWKPIGTPMPKAKAIRLGELTTLKTLAASFKIVPSKKRIATLTEESYLPSPQLFRTYKIVRGRKIPLQYEWIQRKTTRLGRRTEVGELHKKRREYLRRKKVKWL